MHDHPDAVLMTKVSSLEIRRDGPSELARERLIAHYEIWGCRASKRSWMEVLEKSSWLQTDC